MSDPDFPPGPVEPVGSAARTPYGTEVQLFRCTTDANLWICETDGGRRTWRLVTKPKKETP